MYSVLQGVPRQKVFALVVLMLGCFGVIQSGIGQKCNVVIRKELYFQPATEMAGEKTFPEVVIIENEEISVWSVPNRGRLIFDLIRKETGRSQLVATRTPLPVRFRGVYTFEFGGIYSTFPWHKRDHQPLLLDMELLKDDEVCGLRMWSTDPGTDISLIAELFLPPIGAETRLDFRLVNPRPVDQIIDFGLVMVARPGGAMSENTELLIPVASVMVGESDGQWMGERGREVPWPAAWRMWGDFVRAGSFYVDVKSMSAPFVAVYNPHADEALRLSWDRESPWTMCEIFSWGPAYAGTIGAYDGFRFELKAEKLTIPKGSERVLQVRIAVLGERPSDGLSEH